MASENAKTFKEPIDWDELYPGRFLKAADLRGQRATLTIKLVAKDELESNTGKKVKGVLSFEETPLQVALNRTNGICLREMFGRLLPVWRGKRVTFFAGTWDGEPCLRVYGSPDIAEDRVVMVALPRRKPFPMTMHRIVKRNGAAAQPPPPPPPPIAESEFDDGGAFDELIT